MQEEAGDGLPRPKPTAARWLVHQQWSDPTLINPSWADPELRCVTGQSTAGKLPIGVNNASASYHIPQHSHCARQRPHWSAFISDSTERAQKLAGLADSGSAGSATLRLYSRPLKVCLFLSDAMRAHGPGLSHVGAHEETRVMRDSKSEGQWLSGRLMAEHKGRLVHSLLSSKLYRSMCQEDVKSLSWS